jgi:hypothetical protein
MVWRIYLFPDKLTRGLAHDLHGQGVFGPVPMRSSWPKRTVMTVYP